MNASWPRGVGVRAVCAWVVLAIMFILLCAANLPVATAPQAPQSATLSATPGGVAGGARWTDARPVHTRERVH